MHKFLWKGAFELVANSFWKLNTSQHGRMIVAGPVEAFRAFTTCNGYQRSSITESLQEQIVNALRLGERSKASILLSELASTSEALRASDFLLILKDCARLPDPLFALETWKLMEEKEIDVHGKCYFYTFRALCRGGYLKEAFSLMSFLRDNPDIYPLLPVYNNFLSACAQTSSATYANDCLNLMEHQMVGKNETTYAELLKLAVLQQNLSAVHEIWKECIKYYSLSIISLRKFVWSFTRLRDLESAYVTLQYMVALACQGNCIITKTVEGKLFDSRLDIPIPSNGGSSLKRCSTDTRIVPIVAKHHVRTKVHTSNIECNLNVDMESQGKYRVRTSMPEKVPHMRVMKVVRWSFNDVIHACANMGNYILAERLMLQMQNLGLEPSCSTYDGFLRAVLAERGFHNGIEVVRCANSCKYHMWNIFYNKSGHTERKRLLKFSRTRCIETSYFQDLYLSEADTFLGFNTFTISVQLKVMEQKNMKPYDSTLAAISVSCSKGLELDLAETFLDQISTSPSPYPYNALLEACDTMDQPERAIRVLAKMKKLKIQPDIRTYELLFSLFGNVNAPYEEGNMLSQVDATKRINAIEMDMMKNGIQHSHGSLKNLLKALGMEGMIKELIQYLRVAENPLSSAYSFLGAPIYNVVLHSFVDARETNMAAETFKTMKSFGIPSDAGTYNIMIYCCSIMKCYRSASVLVSLMIRDGFYPNTVTYTTLITTLLGLDDFDESLKLLNQGKIDGIEPDLLLYNSILQAACEKGRIDVVELIVEQMHQEKIQPDLSTCSYVFSAYVEAGFCSTAIEALQVLSMRMISEEDDILEETRIEYEYLIISEDMETELHIMKLFRDSEDLALALLNLRWCAVAGLPISWLPNENQWAKRLAENHASQSMLG